MLSHHIEEHEDRYEHLVRANEDLEHEFADVQVVGATELSAIVASFITASYRTTLVVLHLYSIKLIYKIYTFLLNIYFIPN